MIPRRATVGAPRSLVMAVRMELSRILIREMSDMQIIELTEVGGERKFPIVIGLPEAFAIERRLKGIEIPRPQTHDLLATVIQQLGGTLKHIVIHSLAEGTFFAKLVIQQDSADIEVDSRPSDAIALGVAGNVPIYVAEDVLDQTDADAAKLFGSEAEDIDFDDEDDEKD
jgi:uncharacterized protein